MAIFHKQVFVFFSIFALFSCSNHQVKLNAEQAYWDFDHHVQFKQKQIAASSYQLEIIPNDKVSFERLATFLLRRASVLCQGYGYKLEVLDGVESFDHFRASPNLIMGNLTAKLECPISQ